HVARLARQEQVQLAAGDTVTATDAIPGPARRADGRVARLDLQWRDQRLHEVELTDRAQGLAERGATEQTVCDECRDEVAESEAGRPKRPVPKVQRLISPQEGNYQEHGQPLAPQLPRPGQAGR